MCNSNCAANVGMSWRAANRSSAVKPSLRSNSTHPAQRVSTATALFLLATPPCCDSINARPSSNQSATGCAKTDAISLSQPWANMWKIWSLSRSATRSTRSLLIMLLSMSFQSGSCSLANPPSRGEIATYEDALHMPVHTSSPATIMSVQSCLLYTSPSPRDRQKSRMPSSA